jgi:hypothetical protein
VPDNAPKRPAAASRYPNIGLPRNAAGRIFCVPSRPRGGQEGASRTPSLGGRAGRTCGRPATQYRMFCSTPELQVLGFARPVEIAAWEEVRALSERVPVMDPRRLSAPRPHAQHDPGTQRNPISAARASQEQRHSDPAELACPTPPEPLRWRNDHGDHCRKGQRVRQSIPRDLGWIVPVGQRVRTPSMSESRLPGLPPTRVPHPAHIADSALAPPASVNEMRSRSGALQGRCRPGCSRARQPTPRPERWAGGPRCGCDWRDSMAGQPAPCVLSWRSLS